MGKDKIDFAKLERKFYKEFAKRFVAVWIADGEEAAGEYAVKQMVKSRWHIAKPYVDDEFKEQGYDTTGKMV